MKNLILAFFALMIAPLASNAQVSDCIVNLVVEAYAEYIIVGAVDFPEGAVLNWSIDGVVMNNGSDLIELSAILFLNGPVEICIFFETLECPNGVELCETIDINDIIGGGCVDPTFIDPLAICDTMWAPVCGCDGNTYSNECVALYIGGVTSWTQGECGGGGGGDCPEMIEAGPQLKGAVCSWIFEIPGGGTQEGVSVEWSFGDGSGEVSGFLADHTYAVSGVYEVSALYTSSTCTGVLFSTVIVAEGCNELPICELYMGYEFIEDSVFFEAYGYPEGVFLEWYFNGELIASGTDVISESTEGEIPPGGIEICVIYESPECPYGAWACEYFETEENCALYLDGFVQNNYGVFEAYGFPNEVNLIWEIAGEVVAEGVSFLEVDDLQFDATVTVCVSYETTMCGLVEACEIFMQGGEGDCPEEIMAIPPKWSFCQWAFEIEGVINEQNFVIWNFGDGSNDVEGSSWVVYDYSTNGVFEVSALYFSEACPLGTMMSTTIEVWGCGNEVDCIDQTQIDPSYACTEEYVPVCGCNNVTYSNACYAYHYGGVTTFVEGECETAVTDLEGEASWTVYPTPTTGNLVISGLNEGVWPCKMYDSQGRIVLTTEVSNGQEFSLYGLSDGWYTLQIVGVLGSAKRVIVQR
jgi:PKD repeat protein